MSLRRRTLRGRVSLLALAVVAGWVVLLAVGFDYVLSSRLDKQVDDELRVRSQAASATLRIDSGAITGVRESATDSELDSSIWVYAGTRAIRRPNLPPSVQRVADRMAASGSTYVDGAQRRFYSLPVRAGGRRIGSVVAAVDTEPFTETKRTALAGSGIVAVLLLGGAYLALRFAAARALRPVARMTRQAADWSVTAPAQRFGAGQQYEELGTLASTLDALLDRLAAVLRHERRLSAELSHELRTPLARVMGEVDLMLDAAGPEQRRALESIRESCAAMDGIIDTLLAAARAELVRTVGHSDLDPVLKSFGDSARPAVRAADTWLSVGIDADVVTRILAPIVDNARRYAGTEVRLAARAADGGVAITIANDGPRLPAELAEQVFEPGYTRRDGDGHSGAGLGLALSRRLARAADGDVVVDPAAPITTFVLTLPAG